MSQQLPRNVDSGSGGGSQIKGGGRAILSDTSRQELISFLMRLPNYSNSSSTNNDVNDSDSSNRMAALASYRHYSPPLYFSSKNEQQRKQDLFVKRLVRQYERERLTQKFNGATTTSSTIDDANVDSFADKKKKNNNKKKTPPLVAKTKLTPSPPTSATAANNNKDSKVRVEVVEAIFKNNAGKNQRESDENSKGVTKKGTNNNKFREGGARKLLVVLKSTTMQELLKLVEGKLRMKQKAVRAFVVVEGYNASMIVDLHSDLSGITDGTIIYVTSSRASTDVTSTERTNTDDDKSNLQDPPTDSTLQDYLDSTTNKLIDPLDAVKRTYIIHDQKEQRKQRSGGEQMASEEKSNNAISTVRANDVNKKKNVASLERARAQLPVTAYRDDILNSIQANRVLVLCGSTGCGKSTQVPQFIYEQTLKEETVLSKNSPPDGPNTATTTSNDRRRRRPYIVVTQPRRVAAISLAQRVAEETRSPPPGAPGSLVGYIVRLDRRVADESCRIIYCTVGILLRLLVCPQPASMTGIVDDDDSSMPPLSVDTISHLIVDEVHERDVNTDFCLTVIKERLPLTPHLKLILMSATASAQAFVEYYSSATKPALPAVLEIPGRSFPVQIRWLEDCEHFVGRKIVQNGLQKTKPRSDRPDKKAPNEKNEADDDGRCCPILSRRASDRIDNQFITSLIRKIMEQQQADGHVNITLSNRDDAVSKRASKKRNAEFRESGAILVFLPGRAEIDALARCLFEDKTLLGCRETCTILKLHSSISRSDQQRAFQPVPRGSVKIILSTNLAESSVTISDVSHCIDTAIVKESRFNSEKRIRELVTVYCSKASGTQRAGRAGRTSAGTCWRLISNAFWESQMLDQTVPEMLRTPLDELLLQISLLYEQRRDEIIANSDNGVITGNFPSGVRPIRFLSKTPTPPAASRSVEASMHLLEVGALRVVEDATDPASTPGSEASTMYRLTPLGYHLSRLPMDVKVGKVLIVGCILGCLDGALTIASTLSCSKSCFLPGPGGARLTPDQKDAWHSKVQAREILVENGFGGRDWKGGTVKGDLIAVIATYNAWKLLEWKERKDFCDLHALHHYTLIEMDQLRSQFLESLIGAGFVSKPNTNDTVSTVEECNQASDDALLTSCCLVAGLYPNIFSLRRGGVKGGRLLTKEGDMCHVQGSSFQSKRLRQVAETGKDAYGVFHTKHRTISNTKTELDPQVFLTEVNFVSRFALLLFGGELNIVNDAIIIDGWLKFKIGCDKNKESDAGQGEALQNAVLIQYLRDALDDTIRECIMATSLSNPEDMVRTKERHKAVIELIRLLLSEEG